MAALLKEGAKLDLKDQAGETAIMKAHKYKQDDIVRLLVHHGAKLTGS